MSVSSLFVLILPHFLDKEGKLFFQALKSKFKIDRLEMKFEDFKSKFIYKFSTYLKHKINESLRLNFSGGNLLANF